MRTLPFLLAALIAAPAYAQEPPPRIWDMAFGTHVDDLPAREFVDPACGSNGGPAGAALAGFGEFARCPADAAGLHEITFIYDDTLEYVAEAVRNPALVARYRANAVNQQPVIVSLLVDAAGYVRGWRIFTDPRADEAVRYDAYLISAPLRARFGTGWQCTDLPRLDGETPIEGTYVKQHCEKAIDGGRASVDARLFYRPGQTLVDRFTGLPTVNAFESRASIEVLQAAPYPAAAPRAEQTATATQTYANAREAFLAGAAKDCPGCDLVDADLRRRNLEGADLIGANLEGAVLHRANLRSAKLMGARLAGANLNRADLTFANLAGANLQEAMLWQTDAARADFSRVQGSGALMGKVRLALANLEGAVLVRVDFGEARLNDARFAGADLTESFFYRAALFRADLAGATVDQSIFVEASLREAKLVGTKARAADFLSADLAEADLTNADFANARLLGAILTGAKQDGANFAGALMPDNTVRP
jgi:uncharacterized protein YjbI with pentapeptide repeats